MFFPVNGWFVAFVLTVAIEMPIAAWILRRAEPDLARRLALIVFANLVTHPAVWWVFSQLFLVGTLEYTLAAEAWAVGAEAVFYAVTIRNLGARRAIVVAVLANGASFAIGRVVGAISPELFR
ncbi:MAG TPA: hypothetical protein VK871_01000 [Candidatus Limnocylindrales bacterium]|nr:hypothetical protein [Candidatus Limnocylindrales bacterium]